MFSKASKNIRNSIYGVLCQSPLKDNRVNFGNGTAFMIAPGVCATAAHVLHIEGDKNKPLHSRIEVIRCPDIGGQMSMAKLIAEDVDRDLALIEIINPPNTSTVTLHRSVVDRGTSCGALGFPLSSVIEIDKKPAFNLLERFQGAYISAFQNMRFNNNPAYDYYETDALMYGGSSGCPGFTVDEKVFGMHIATITEGKQNNNSSRLAIALWIPSMDIVKFAGAHGVRI